MRFVLGSGVVLEVPRGRSILGSGPSARIQVQGEGVRSEHLSVLYTSGKVWLQALDGAPLEVNGAATASATVGGGDRVRVGGLDVAVEEGAPRASTGPLPVPRGTTPTVPAPPPAERREEAKSRAPFSGEISRAPSEQTRDLGSFLSSKHRRPEELLLLLGLADLVRHAQSASELGPRAMQILASHFGADVGALVHFGAGDGEIVARVGREQPPSQRALARVRQQGVSILTTDAGQDERLEDSQSILLMNVRAVLCAPFFDGASRVVGAIYLHARVATFQPDSLVLLEAASAFVGAALERALLVRDLERRVELATEELARRAETLEAKNAQLAELNEQRETLSALLAHDLTGAVAVVKGNVDLARGGIEVEESLRRAQVGVGRLANMVAELVDVSRLEAGKLPIRLEPVPARSFLAEVAERWGALGRERSITIEVQAPAETVIALDTSLVGRVLDNLVRNAIRYAPERSTITLHAAVHGDGKPMLVVADHGPGVPVEAREVIFQKFGRANTRDAQSRGLGLYFCALVAASHGGAIWVEGGPGANRFCFTVDERVRPAEG